jgi:antitoxin (DNA-binding transcriptional repressor) of toxin-antitoxin stability system
MKVKTGELKNNLSRYLKRLAQTGESITILDRDRPVARITPIRGKRGAADSGWAKKRAKLLDRAAKLGIKLTVPEKEPRPFKSLGIKPRVAPDGKTETNSVVEMRREKDY